MDCFVLNKLIFFFSYFYFLEQVEKFQLSNILLFFIFIFKYCRFILLVLFLFLLLNYSNESNKKPYLILTKKQQQNKLLIKYI